MERVPVGSKPEGEPRPGALFWGGGKLCPGLLEGSLIFWGENPCSPFDLSPPQDSPEIVQEPKIQNTGGKKVDFSLIHAQAG